MSNDERAPDEARGNLINESLPSIPEEFTELQALVATHRNLLVDQAALLRARYEAFLSVGFTESEALQFTLHWGLNKNLTDS